MTLPMSTSDIERGFPTMNRIKTGSRNRLKTENLDRLIRLSAEGPSLENFNYEAAAEEWARKSKRISFLKNLFIKN